MFIQHGVVSNSARSHYYWQSEFEKVRLLLQQKAKFKNLAGQLHEMREMISLETRYEIKGSSPCETGASASFSM